MRSLPDTRRSTGYQYENSQRSCLEGGRKGGRDDRGLKRGIEERKKGSWVFVALFHSSPHTQMKKPTESI